MKVAALLVLVVTAVATPVVAHGSSSASSGRIPQAQAVSCVRRRRRVLADDDARAQGATAWVACKDQARVVRMPLPCGRKTATLGLDGPVIAVAVGLGSVWALDSGSTLYRIDAGTCARHQRIRLGASAAYNIWIGAGAVWIADDQGAARPPGLSRPRTG